jgi:hypothetical protein
MGTYHTVVQGDYLAKIARQYGFADWRTLWNAPENKDLKDKRKNPNVLFPGDSLFIPDKETKEESRPTEQRHRFQRLGEALMLRIVIQSANGKPIANASCQLQIDGTVYPLKSNAQGMIEQAIPATAEGGKLIVESAEFPFREIPVKIGHLDPVEEIPGQQARLNHLGYNAGDSAHPNPAWLRSAIEEFQCEHGLTVDGVCGPKTQAKLKEAHGC